MNKHFDEETLHKKDKNELISLIKNLAANNRSYLENSPDVILRISDKNEILFMNEAACQFFGKEQQKNYHLSEFFDEKHSRLIADFVHTAIESKHPLESKFLYTYDMKESIFYLSVIPELSFTDDASSVIVKLRDVSKQAFAESDYQTLFETMQFGFAVHEIITDSTGVAVDYRFLSSNKAFENLTGLKSEEILNRTVKEVLPNIEQYWIDSYGKVALTGKSISFEQYSAPLNRYYDVTAYSPRVRQFATIFQDVTERRNYEQNLKKERDLLQTLTNSSPAGIAIVDKIGKIVSLNKKAEEILGRTIENFDNPTFDHALWENTDWEGNLLSPEELPVALTLKHKKSFFNINHAIHTPTGEKRFISVNTAPLFDENHELTTIIANFTDITEQKKIIEADKNRLSRLQKQQAAIVEIALDENSIAGNIDEAARITAEKVAVCLDLDNVSIWLIDENKKIMHCLDCYQSATSTHKSGKQINPQKYPRYMSALNNGRSIFSHDMSNDFNFKELYDDIFSSCQTSSSLDAGIRIVGEIVGMICFGKIDNYLWESDEISFAGEVADQIAQILVNNKRMQAVAALEDSEERFAFAIDASNDAIWDWNLKTGETYFSPRWYAMLGYSQEDLPHNQNAWSILLHPEDRDRAAKIARDAIDNKKNNYAMEFRLKQKSGDWRWILAKAKVVEKTEDGSAVRLVGTHTDITERKVTEMQLRLQSMAVEQSMDGIIMLDLDFKIIFSNRSWAKMFGYTKIELMGKSFEIFFTEAQREKYWLPCQKELFKNEKYQAAFTQIKRDAELIQTRISAAVFKGHKKENAGIIIIAHDITEELKLEEQLRQAQKMESVGRLAGGIAHDFNNLLTPIQGYSELLLQDIDREHPFYEGTSEIFSAAGRAKILVSQLLSFSRKQMLEVKIVDLNVIIKDFSKILKRTIREDIHIETYFASNLYSVLADAYQIEQVLMNLAVNSQDAMLQGGLLTIETANVFLDEEYCRSHNEALPGDYAMIAVSDTGCGMKKETVEHIFEPFYTTKERGKGTGLGLSTVYGLIKQHKGNIWVYSELGEGTTFKIYLPKAEVELTPSEPLSQTRVLKSGEETIMVVEDNDMVRSLAVSILQRYGYHVLQAKIPSECVKIIADFPHKIDLLVTDVIMPEMNGKQLYNRVAAILPEIKVLYMSGYTENVIAHHGVLDHGLNFIQKPFSIQGLIEKVQEIFKSL